MKLTNSLLALSAVLMMSLSSCDKVNKYIGKFTDKTEEEETEQIDSSGETESKEIVEEVETPAVKLYVKAQPGLHLGAQSGNTYESSNLLDGNPKTAWAIGLEQVSSYDFTEFPEDLLEFTADAKDVKYIMLTNGYAKNSNVYNNNSRLSRIVISRVPISSASGSDILYYGDVADTMSPQRLEVNEDYDNSRPTRKIYVTIPDMEFITGDKFTDICISEIEFYGHENN